jgi:hypothetical protein
MKATPEIIDGFFKEYGWTYTRRDEPEKQMWTWDTGFRGDVQSFSMFVRLTEFWVYFTISPFVVKPKNPDCTVKLHKFLLRANYDVNVGKFALDEKEDIVLTVEMPNENLDYSEFRDGINIVCHYADKYIVDALNLATNPNATHAYLEPPQQTTTPPPTSATPSPPATPTAPSKPTEPTAPSAPAEPTAPTAPTTPDPSADLDWGDGGGGTAPSVDKPADGAPSPDAPKPKKPKKPKK